MRIQTIAVIGATVTAVGVTGCGSAGSAAASRPDPPAPITLSAFVGRGTVRVSPVRLGAGPVLLTVADQSPRAIALVITRAGSGRAIARTAPINPEGATQVKLDLGSGEYTVAALMHSGRHGSASAGSDRSAALTTMLHVGPERTSSGDQVLEP
jgi:hypothetical protein